MYKNMKKTAVDRGWQKPVSQFYLKELWDNQKGLCYWSGMPMEYVRGMNSNPKSVSVDRLDCSLGYIPGNIVLTCFWANMGRGRTHKDKWIEFMKELNLEGAWKTNKQN